MNFIDNFERKHRNFGIKGLMTHVCLITMIVFIVDILSGYKLSPYLYLERGAIFGQLQLWRLVTFLFIPATDSIFWIIFYLMLYYTLGTALEGLMGTCRFNLYYICCAAFTVISALIFGGWYSGYYVYMCMFLVFAYFYPHYQIMLFFIIPVEVQYLAFFNLAVIAIDIIKCLLVLDIATVITILAPFGGIFLFFGPTMIDSFKAFKRRRDFRKKMRD